MVEERTLGPEDQFDEEYTEGEDAEGEEDSVEFVHPKDAFVNENLSQYSALGEEGRTDYVKEKLSRLWGTQEALNDREILLRDKETKVGSLESRRSLYRWGLGAAIVAAAALGLSTVVLSGKKNDLQERLAALDSLSVNLKYANTDSALAELGRAQQSLWNTIYWSGENERLSAGIDSLDARLGRAGKSLSQTQERLTDINDLTRANGYGSYEEVFQALSAKPTATVVQGYNKGQLKEAQAQARASGYEAGLQVGQAKTLPLFSQQARELDYTRSVEPGLIRYGVKKRAQPLTGLQPTLEEERELNRFTGELTGLGVRIDDINNYTAGKDIEILVTISPTGRAPLEIGVKTEGKIKVYSPR